MMQPPPDTAMPSAVIMDPYGPYAALLIDRLYRNHGVTTICLHTDWKARLRSEGKSRILRSPAVAAHYMITDPDWASIAQSLARRHHIVGVLPYEEGTVAPLSALAAHLGLSWAQPEVQQALRDKNALKELVARNNPTIRLNVFRKVATAEEAMDVVRDHDLHRFVLKPNDGSGNNNVAFFDSDVDIAVLREYFADGSSEVLLEEFIQGQEFWVNGQMDAAGQPTVVGIGRYFRTHRNNIENLQVGSMSVDPSDPRFEPLRDYACSAMSAVGLRRSPFHLELIIDARGPCLVEVGGRLCGELGALRDMAHHGPQLDLIEVAAHYYVSDEPLGPLPLDWERVRSFWIAVATGDSTRDQRLVRVEGTEEVQASPHFLFWIKKPAPSDFVWRTTSLTTRAWAVALAGSHDLSPRETIDWARQTVRLHGADDQAWSLADKWPMYEGLMNKAWVSRPRWYEMRALMQPLK